jgi:hypothetical protein
VPASEQGSTVPTERQFSACWCIEPRLIIPIKQSIPNGYIYLWFVLGCGISDNRAKGRLLPIIYPINRSVYD